MTILHHPDRLTEIPDGTAKADFITGLIALAAYHTAHPEAPLPTRSLNIPVPPGPRGQRIEMLTEIAATHDLNGPRPDGHGGLIADAWYGPIRVEAHLAPQDISTSEWLARARNSAGRTATRTAA